MPDRPVLVWYRHDLRTDDHPALAEAARSGAPVAALYVLDDAVEGRTLGAASRWWLHHGLLSLGNQLGRHGIPLILRRGPSSLHVPDVAARLRAQTVTWNAASTPAGRQLDETVRGRLAADGVRAIVGPSDLIAEPGALRNQAGQPFRIFAAFWRSLSRHHAPRPPIAPPALLLGTGSSGNALGDRLEDWAMLPRRPDGAEGFRETWSPGEDGAAERLQDFLAEAADGYAAGRDRPAVEGTSRLSPHLRFGEISVRRIWHATTAVAGPFAEPFLRELGWREFSRHALFLRPDMADQPLRPEFKNFPFSGDEEAFAAWREGRTGYPIVDAGMRQLWHTGWLHNRVRMIAASFLVKDLLLPWQCGERWFWDTLVDADPANNPANWQWVMGCGIDASPFFRIFNPVLQGEKFDPGGRYVRRWVPELAAVPDREVHRPKAGRPNYPPPIIDHAGARERALEAFAALGRGT